MHGTTVTSIIAVFLPESQLTNLRLNVHMLNEISSN